MNPPPKNQEIAYAFKKSNMPPSCDKPHEVLMNSRAAR